MSEGATDGTGQSSSEGAGDNPEEPSPAILRLERLTKVTRARRKGIAIIGDQKSQIEPRTRMCTHLMIHYLVEATAARDDIDAVMDLIATSISSVMGDCKVLMIEMKRVAGARIVGKPTALSKLPKDKIVQGARFAFIELTDLAAIFARQNGRKDEYEEVSGTISEMMALLTMVAPPDATWIATPRAPKIEDDE